MTPQKAEAVITSVEFPNSPWEEPYLRKIGEIVGIETCLGTLKITLQYPESEELPFTQFITSLEYMRVTGPTNPSGSNDEITSRKIVYDLLTEVRQYESLLKVCKALRERPKEKEEILINEGFTAKAFRAVTLPCETGRKPAPTPFIARMLELRKAKETQAKSREKTEFELANEYMPRLKPMAKPSQSLAPNWSKDFILQPPEAQKENPKFQVSNFKEKIPSSVA